MTESMQNKKLKVITISIVLILSISAASYLTFSTKSNLDKTPKENKIVNLNTDTMDKDQKSAKLTKKQVLEISPKTTNQNYSVSSVSNNQDDSSISTQLMDIRNISEEKDLTENQNQNSKKDKVEESKKDQEIAKRGNITFLAQDLSAIVGSDEYSSCSRDRLNIINAYFENLKSKKFIRRGNVYIDSEDNKSAFIVLGNQNAFFGDDGNPKLNVSFSQLTPNILFHFDFDMYSSVKWEERKTYLTFLNNIKNHDKIDKIIVIGHTCEIGTEDYNYELSSKRSLQIAKDLNSYGYDVLVRPKGEFDPISENQTDEGKSLNRRVEIFIIGASG